MPSLTRTPRDGAFIASEANGFRSRETVSLKAGSLFLAGSVLATELDGSDAPTGFHILAPDTATEACVLIHETDARDGAVEAAVIARDAEVKSGLLTLATGTTLADATAILAATGIIVRRSI